MWDSLIITPFVNVLLLIYSLVGNFGIAIILFTILIRLITQPLTARQMKASQSMQELQKDEEWIEIQKKYKTDKEKLSQEQMRIYKLKGINPFASCLPTLIQLPIIIGLYQSLVQAMATSPLDLLKLTRFISPALLNIDQIIPLNSKFLWMDLGQPERLNVFGIGIPVLAIVVVITTYLQGKLMQTPSANPGDQSSMMGNMMNIYMPFLMGWLALTLASGLSLYFVTSNLIGITQYGLMGKLNWSNLLPKKKQIASQTPPALPGKSSSSKPSKSQK
jgi:YidC/Oxa1 family membrane protein insertase